MDNITLKTAKPLYLLRQLKKAWTGSNGVLQLLFYFGITRSVLEHARQVFHQSLPG